MIYKHAHTHELNRLLQGGRDATLRVSPPECSSVINLKVYFIQKYTASSIEGGSFFPPNAESAKIQWNHLTLPIPEKPGMEKEPYRRDTGIGAFSVQARLKRGPFDALSVVCLAPAPQEECLTESWHDSGRVAAPGTKTGRNISKGRWHGEEKKTLETSSQWCIAVA